MVRRVVSIEWVKVGKALSFVMSHHHRLLTALLVKSCTLSFCHLSIPECLETLVFVLPWSGEQQQFVELSSSSTVKEQVTTATCET